jgi:ribonuclease PH
MRPLVIEPGFIRNAEGSALVTAGGTRVVVTASVEDRVPPFLKDQRRGWITWVRNAPSRHE